SIASPTPQSRTDITPRVDLQLGEKNTLVTRFRYSTNERNNNGVGGLSLPSMATNSNSSEATVQISDTQVINARVINETRFEFERDSSSQTPFSTAPSINVQGNFSNGGAGSGKSSGHDIHIEGQNYTSIQLEKNFIRLGVRVRSDRSASSTTAGTNGSFTYNCLLTSQCANQVNPRSFENGLASQFSISGISKPVSATVWDLGIYAEDDWKVRPNLTLSY